MRFLSLLIFTVSSFVVQANEVSEARKLTTFAHEYFNKMVATQMPTASEKELDDYLTLLTDDVGHAHLPWVVDDSRYPDGKQKMKKGMTYYLGAHTEFRAKLLSIYTFNNSAIAIRYQKWIKGVHPQTGKIIDSAKTFMEVLELEDGKVAVIRKYHE
ncbi:nuclear transport factor 2 family protein [Colwelliaceae bacterium 6441]